MREKIKKKEYRIAKKKAKEDSLQSENDRETRVHEMAAGASVLIPPIFYAEGDSSTALTIVHFVPVVDRIITDESRTWSEGPCAEIIEPVP